MHCCFHIGIYSGLPQPQILLQWQKQMKHYSRGHRQKWTWFKGQNTDYCRYGIKLSWGQCVGNICHYSYIVTVLSTYQTSQICLVNLLLNSIYYNNLLHTGGTEISGTACEILWSQEILYLWRNTRFDPVKREVSLTSRDTQCTRPVNHLTSTWTNTMM